MQFIWFLGRFHVLIVHLPLGILTLAVALEILVRFKPFKFLEGAVGPTWAAGALSAIGTVALGLMHASEASFQDMPAVDAHRIAGTSLCIATCIVAVLRLRMHPVSAWPSWAGSKKRVQPVYNAIQPAFARGGLLDRTYARLWGVPVAIVTVLMFVTGHLGGNLTHGDTYLTEYAPNPIRLALGLPPTLGPRPKPKDLASADLYLDVVGPALQQRCSTCHNDSKKSGGLSMASYDSLIKGGEKGPVIVAGSAGTSDLFHRISLTADDKDFMPKDGKTPLTKNEVKAIGAWIAAGAPKTGLVGGMKLTADASAAIQAVIGAGAGGGDEQASAAVSPDFANLPAAPAADPKLIADMNNSGFIVRPITAKGTLLDVDFTAQRPLTQADIDSLVKLSPQVFRLNLRSASLTDAQLKALAGMQNLRQLRLENNPVTNAGVTALTGLKSLRSLNIVATKIADDGLATLGAMPSLREVYVWHSAVTDAGIARFKKDHDKILVDAGLKPTDIKKDTRMIVQP